MKNAVFGFCENWNRLLSQGRDRRRQILAAVVGILALLVASTDAKTPSGESRKITGASHSSGDRGKGFFTIYPDFGSQRAKWRKVGNRVRMSIPPVRNLSSTRTTGTLRVYLIAGKRSSAVARGKGRILAFRTYSYVLPPNYFFTRLRARVRLLRQPRGWVRTAMVLGEYNGYNYSARDVIRFPGRVRFR